MKSPPLVANGKTRVLRLCGVQWLRRRSEEILHPDFEALPAAPVEGIFWPSVRGLGERTAAAATGPPPSTRSTLRADNKKPGDASTSRARHRRYEPLCTPDLTAALLAMVQTMPRDRRHETAAAYPDVEAWLDYLILRSKAARTVYAYERAVAPLLRRHPDKTLGEFTSADINAELSVIPPRSRYIPRSIYNQFFKWAMWDERIDRSPMAKVPEMSAGKRRHKDIFSEAEQALCEGLPSPDGPLFTILFGTGIRGGEARALRRSHIDLGRMRLVVYSGKGDKDRTVPFGPAVATAVADLDLLERLEPTDHLWHRRRYPPGDRRRRNDPIGSTTFDTWYRDMLELAGVRQVDADGNLRLNPHQTRHTYAWTIRQAGLDLEDRQALLGHESPETTVRQYGRVDIEELAAKVARL